MLDIVTVMVFVNAVMLFICIVTGLAWWAGEPGHESRYWFDASIMQLAGTLALMAGGHAWVDVVLAVSGFFLTAATGFVTLGYRQLYGLPAARRWPLLIAFLTAMAAVSIRFVSGGTDDGIYMLYFGASFNLIVGARAVWSGSAAAEMRFGRAAAMLLLAYAVGCATVGFFAFIFPVEVVYGLPESTWLELSSVPLFVLNLATFVMTLIVKLERATERQRHLATHDALTGALNRRAFYEIWGSQIGRGGVLALLDIDHFKSVNDTHGHLTGDVALKTFAAAIADALPRGAVFGRLGGEEFAVLFPAGQPGESLQVLEELRQAVGSKVVQSCEGRSFRVTFSAGLVALDDIGSDVNRAFAAADRALYVAKSTGRDRVVAFEVQMHMHQETHLAANSASEGPAPLGMPDLGAA